jgi:hypothetical protein
MAADPLDSLRLTLMQDVLPVGLAVAERARRGSPRPPPRRDRGLQ